MTVNLSAPMAVTPTQGQAAPTAAAGSQQAAAAAPQAQAKGKGKGKAFGKDFIPPGIAKKLPPPTPQPVAPPQPQPLGQPQLLGQPQPLRQPQPQQPVLLPGGVTPTNRVNISPIGTPTPIGTPVVPPQQAPTGLPPISSLNQAIFNPATGSLPQLNGQPTTILGSAVPGLNPVSGLGGLTPTGLNNSPAILDGVAQAFGSGNPLAGPIQLVNNINANALSTIRSVGLA